MTETIALKPAAFRFQHALGVRWSEVDAQNIVFNAHYLMYVDTAVAEYWRALALPYAASLDKLGGELFVRKAKVEYLAPARFDDRLSVGIRFERVGESSLTLRGAVFREHRLLASAEIVYVFADAPSRQPRRLPDALRQALAGYELGEPMTWLKTGAWAELQADAQPLRHAVFVQEQGVPVEEEWDAADATALHAVLYNRLSQPIATGRLLQDAPGIARIGRMAVDHGVRGYGYGAQVLDGLIAAARARGDTEVQLHAQQSAVSFYRRRGFVDLGEPFEEVGIPHQGMRLVF
ncbi:MAG: Acetyltransferase [Paracidovorax wautersii]|uniref:Acetyltransferase n=1 Tax=Paracidovorax wautersii TaxID=1177982 RepID=A0A7V8JPU6_9BURK|nr:MAG: Acetyltransferase [Paracidovorax wautersii]